MFKFLKYLLLFSVMLVSALFMLTACVENIVLEYSEESDGQTSQDAGVQEKNDDDGLSPIDVFDKKPGIDNNVIDDTDDLIKTPGEIEFEDLKNDYSDISPLEEEEIPHLPPPECRLWLSRDRIVFDNAPVGSISKQTFYLKNISLADCQIYATHTYLVESVFNVGTEVDLDFLTGGYTLIPGGKLDFTVTFEPQEVKVYDDKVLILTDSNQSLFGTITAELVGYVRD